MFILYLADTNLPFDIFLKEHYVVLRQLQGWKTPPIPLIRTNFRFTSHWKLELSLNKPNAKWKWNTIQQIKANAVKRSRKAAFFQLPEISYLGHIFISTNGIFRQKIRLIYLSQWYNIVHWYRFINDWTLPLSRHGSIRFESEKEMSNKNRQLRESLNDAMKVRIEGGKSWQHIMQILYAQMLYKISMFKFICMGWLLV